MKPLQRFRRGYAGWLMMNQQFLDEHDMLLANHVDAVKRWGTPTLEIDAGAASDTDSPQSDMSPQGAGKEFFTDCRRFLLRWCLQGLAAPYLPVPLPPLLAGVQPKVAMQLMEAGGVFFLPITMPVPSRDELRSALDDALHGGDQPEHLEEWLHIIRSENPAKNSMDKFARRFEVQHYWRILHSRHASALKGNLGKVEEVLAEEFGLKRSTISGDIREIREHLGKDWLDRASPV